LPGHGVENVRRPLINTMNLADLLPTSTIWTGSATAPCPMYPPLSPALMHCVTHGRYAVPPQPACARPGPHLHVRPTGAGKSTHLGIIAAQLRRYAGMSIYAFDKGMSMYPLAPASGGHEGQERPAFHGGRR
jgi:type IV secretory pathway VirB4 component